MSQVVQHERPDYEYRPEGLMAEDWGKTGPRTEPPEFVRQSILQQRHWMDNDGSRDSLMYILSLDDATVLEGRLEGSEAHREICRRLGGSTWDGPGGKVNPLWVTARCATEAYDRGLIDEHEMDRIVDE